MSALIEEIEPIVFTAWPAKESIDYDGWVLRASRGVTSRGNSVLANQHLGEFPLQQKIETAESFYRTRNLPPKFQTNPITQPNELEKVLQKRGYQLGDHVLVQTAVLPPQHMLVNNNLTFINSPSLTNSWLNFHQAGNGYSDHVTAVRTSIMKQIALPTVYVTASLDSQIVGIGSAVVMNGWLGVYNMCTSDGYRKQGIGTAVLSNLFQWGQKQGASNTYLQVTAQNQPAQALYQKFGYSTLYAYKHWVKE